ncbi:prolyl oligopeptidase family serine peptidase [Phytomonospora sp. NPDC050363]|uniref:alpha/beta hydrolase family protein n=1 Tax=Phytomonospora sp. NPDC050363 TaxID=3155642 RepID=UPI0033F6F23B
MSRDVLGRAAPGGEVVHYGPLGEQVVEFWRGGSRGLVVFAHGGFWRAEYDRSHVRPLCDDLAGRGYTVAAIEYRRTSPGVLGWPSTFEDVAAAVAAAPGLSGAGELPMVLAGHSAGGHLALWAASGRSGVAGVLALAPVADLAAAHAEDLDGGAVADLLGGSPEEQPERYAAADPMGLPYTAPAVLVHGDADEQVPLGQSYQFTARTGAKLVELPGADHYDLIDPESAVWPAVLAELDGLFA